MSLSLNTDRLLVRAAGGSTRYLHVSFGAPSAPARADRRPLTVAFVLDRSGSMSGQKLALAKRAIDAALTMLRPEDRFSVVTYDDRIDVLVPAMPASAEGRETARERLDSIGARGSTDLCAGWLNGCEQIADAASDKTIARTLLLSDGRANKGITNHAELATRAADLRRAFVVTSTFGVGRDFDESLMAGMADAGGGNFYFIERPEQIQDMLTSELGEALEVVARGVVIDVELPDGAEAELMHRFRATQSGNRMRIELDDLISDQQVSLIVKLQFPQGEIGNAVRVRAGVSSQDEKVEGTSEIAWTFGDNDANDQQSRNVAVDRLVAAIEAAQARRDAVELNRAGNFAAASARMVESVRRVSGYAGNDNEMNHVIASLNVESCQVAQSMDPLAQKRMHYRSSSAMKMREESGRARQDRPVVQLDVQESDGHLFVQMPNRKRFLLATGSSVTLADEGALELLGERFDVLPQEGPVSLEAIRAHVRATIDGLLGTDILSRFFWKLDVPAGVMTLALSDLKATGVHVACGSIAGVPTVQIQVNGHTADAFLDTGAWLSYMPASAAAGMSPVNQQRDFIVFPEPMRFTTDVFERTIRLGELDITSEFAVLPTTVAVPPLARRRWILGAGLLARRPLSFDPQRGIVTFGNVA